MGSDLEIDYEPAAAMSHTAGYRVSRPFGLTLDGVAIVEYSYLGLSTPVVVDYAALDVQLDRSLAYDGSRTSGQYPGLDRFARLVRHTQFETGADGSITAGAGAGAGHPTIPPIVSLGYAYDKASNILEKSDALRGAAQKLNRQYDHDDLDRLIEARRGSDVGVSFDLGAGSQRWALDVIGNGSSLGTDLDRDGVFQSSDDRIVVGDFNDVNEVLDLEQTVAGGSPTTMAFTYDKAENLREQVLASGATLLFTHDAWSRLVKVEHLSDRIPFCLSGRHISPTFLNYSTSRLVIESTEVFSLVLFVATTFVRQGNELTSTFD